MYDPYEEEVRYVSLGGTLPGDPITGPLDIKGNLTIENGDIVVTTGSVSAATGFFASSDDQLKTYLGDIDLDLEKILSIPTRYFFYNNDEEQTKRIGTSAQELKEICPELVETDEDGFLVVDYSKLSILALRALHLVNNKCDKLLNMVEDLKSKL